MSPSDKLKSVLPLHIRQFGVLFDLYAQVGALALEPCQLVFCNFLADKVDPKLAPLLHFNFEAPGHSPPSSASKFVSSTTMPVLLQCIFVIWEIVLIISAW